MRMEALITKALDHKDVRGRGRVIARWREARFLFPNGANLRLAQKIVRENILPDTIREKFFLQKGAQLMLRSIQVAADQIIDRLTANSTKLSESSALVQVKFLKETMQHSPSLTFFFGNY